MNWINKYLGVAIILVVVIHSNSNTNHRLSVVKKRMKVLTMEVKMLREGMILQDILDDKKCKKWDLYKDSCVNEKEGGK